MSGAGRPILFCYDGSDVAGHAIDEAGKVLQAGSAIVVTVWQRVGYAISGYGAASMAAPVDTSDIDLEVEKTCKRTVEEGAERARAAGFDADSATVEAMGPIWEAVLRFADERDAGTIVLGSRGLSGIKSFVLGSVSHGVAHHAHRPVLIVPPPPTDQTDA